MRKQLLLTTILFLAFCSQSYSGTNTGSECEGVHAEQLLENIITNDKSVLGNASAIYEVSREIAGDKADSWAELDITPIEELYDTYKEELSDIEREFKEARNEGEWVSEEGTQEGAAEYASVLEKIEDEVLMPAIDRLKVLYANNSRADRDEVKKEMEKLTKFIGKVSKRSGNKALETHMKKFALVEEANTIKRVRLTSKYFSRVNKYREGGNYLKLSRVKSAITKELDEYKKEVTSLWQDDYDTNHGDNSSIKSLKRKVKALKKSKTTISLDLQKQYLRDYKVKCKKSFITGKPKYPNKCAKFEARHEVNKEKLAEKLESINDEIDVLENRIKKLDRNYRRSDDDETNDDDDYEEDEDDELDWRRFLNSSSTGTTENSGLNNMSALMQMFTQMQMGGQGQYGMYNQFSPQFGQQQFGMNPYGQFGQQPYGQFGQQQFGMNPYGQFGQQQFGMNPYGQFGNSPFGAGQYGQQQYGSPFGQPQYGQNNGNGGQFGMNPYNAPNGAMTSLGMKTPNGFFQGVNNGLRMSASPQF